MWRSLLQRLGHRVVLEHQQGVEQRFTALPRPALDSGQRAVLVFAQGQVVRLEGLQPLRHAQLWARAGDHRQGVDEQPDLRFDVFQLCRAASDSGAETDTVMTAVALQQQQPGRLHQGVDGDFLAAGEIAEVGGLLAIEVGMEMLQATGCIRRGQSCRQLRRFSQGCQLFTPELLAGLRVLALQPGDVIAVAPRRMGGR
ncbi:hypothetical protein D9M71_583150 [compost metagenome]